MAKSKLPLHVRDQNSEQRDFIKKLNSKWDDHPVVKNFHGYWQEWIKWWEGDQYMYYNEYSGRLEDISPLVERETKNVYNRITSSVRQIWGQMRYKHEFYCEPNTAESEDIRSAKLSSKCLEFTNTSPKWQFSQKTNMAKLWALIVGNIYWKEWWNKNLWAYAIDSKGKLFKDKGDIDFTFVNPFNCRPDPQSRIGRRGWRWFMEGKRVPVTSLAEEFGIEAKDIETDPYEKETGLLERVEFERSDEDTAVRKEYYEIPSKDYPKGRMVVSTGQWLFYDDINPNPDHQLGYFQFKGLIPILDEQYGDSYVRLIQEPQRNYNRLCSRVDEHIEEFRIKGMIPWGSLRPGDQAAFRRAGVDYVEFNPRIGQPYFQSPPSVPDSIMNWLANIENEIKEQGSVRDVSMAQLPQYATRASGILFQGLKQQDEIVLLPMVEEWDTTLEEVMTFRLQLIQKHWKMKRMVKLYGKKAVETSINFFSGADIRGNTDVRVKPGIDLFGNRMAKREIVGMMIEKGMIENPKEALELLDLDAGMEEYMEDQFVDKRQANRQLEIMKTKDTYVDGHEDDAHEIHYTVFNNFRKSEEFETLSDKRQKNIQRRIDFHKEFIGLAAPPPGVPTGPGVEEAAPAVGATPPPPIPEAVPGGEAIPPEIMQVVDEFLAEGGA